jgi:hypothetical protein
MIKQARRTNNSTSRMSGQQVVRRICLPKEANAPTKRVCCLKSLSSERYPPSIKPSFLPFDRTLDALNASISHYPQALLLQTDSPIGRARVPMAAARTKKGADGSGSGSDSSKPAMDHFVSHTALLVCAHRVRESRRADALWKDPVAEVFADEVCVGWSRLVVVAGCVWVDREWSRQNPPTDPFHLFRRTCKTCWRRA